MIYKFLPQERIDVLQHLKIRYTPLTSLNDPFESIPLFKLDDLRYKYIKKTLSKFNLSEDETLLSVGCESCEESASRKEQKRAL